MQCRETWKSFRRFRSSAKDEGSFPSTLDFNMQCALKSMSISRDLMLVLVTFRQMLEELWEEWPGPETRQGLLLARFIGGSYFSSSSSPAASTLEQPPPSTHSPWPIHHCPKPDPSVARHCDWGLHHHRACIRNLSKWLQLGKHSALTVTVHRPEQSPCLR